MIDSDKYEMSCYAFVSHSSSPVIRVLSGMLDYLLKLKAMSLETSTTAYTPK